MSGSVNHIDQKVALLPHPVRRCAACRERQNGAMLLHFVNNNGQYGLTIAAGAAKGRGLYLCPSKNCLQKFQAKIAPNTTKNNLLSAITGQLELLISNREQDLARSGNNDEHSPARQKLQNLTKLLVTLRNELTN